MSNDCPIYGHAREWTPLDAWRLALAFRSGVRALAMSESHVRNVINSAAIFWSIRLQLWGSEVQILPGAPAKSNTYAARGLSLSPLG